MELRHTGSSQGDSINIMASIIAASPAATVVICDCYHCHFRLLVGVLWENNVARRMWILSTSFSYDPSVLGPKALDLLHGSLSLAIHAGAMPGFKDFLLVLCPATYPGNSLVRKLGEGLHGCRWSGLGASTQSAREGAQKCTGLENMTAIHLSAFKLLSSIYRAYLAAHSPADHLSEPDVLFPKRGTIPGRHLCQCMECQALAGEQPNPLASPLSIPACCEPQTSRKVVWSNKHCT